MTTQQNQVLCHACQHVLDLQVNSKILKSEECPKCYASVHCCKMCHFYDPKVYNECKEANAERIVEKEKANYCDYFQLKGAQGSGGNNKDELLNLANSLFKN